MLFNGVEIDVYSEESINDAKSKFPGYGIGPLVEMEKLRLQQDEASRLNGEDHD